MREERSTVTAMRLVILLAERGAHHDVASILQAIRFCPGLPEAFS